MESTREAQQFGQLRARIEATFSEPTMIVITSGSRGDGKSATAFGLAQSLAEADHRVLFIDANVEAPLLSFVRGQLMPSSFKTAQLSTYVIGIPGQRFKGISFADERFEAGLSMERVKAAVAHFRSSFDYIIVDTAPLVRSNLAVLFSTIADGTMLTVRLGRLGTAADDETMKTLSRVDASVIGALTVTSTLINSFRERWTTTGKNSLLPIRHVTSRHTIDPEVSREAGATEAPTRSTVNS